MDQERVIITIKVENTKLMFAYVQDHPVGWSQATCLRIKCVLKNAFGQIPEKKEYTGFKGTDTLTINLANGDIERYGIGL